MNSLDIGASGMLAQQLNIDVISNNIANMNTTGFKKQRAEFQDQLYQNIQLVGSQTADTGEIGAGIQVGTGVKVAGVTKIMSQGNANKTDAPLDVMIDGRGFFQVQLPSGDTAYTRAGALRLDNNGQITTQEGYPIQPNITLPNDTVSIAINTSGEVFAKQDGVVTPQNVGQIELAIFPNDAGLEAIGGNLFLETPASGASQTDVPGAIGYGKTVQGSLETSNVNIVKEITDLITAQRSYEMNSRVVQTSDEMLSETNRLTA